MSRREHRVLGWLFTSPYLLYSLVFFLIPLCWAMYLAFSDWNLISPVYNMVGLGNFKKALENPGVRSAFWVTYKFMAFFVPIVVTGSLLVSLLVNSLPRYKSLFLVGYFLPYLASGVATSLVVKGVLSYNSPLNEWLRGSWNLTIDWLGSPVSALLIVAVIIAWKFIGYYSLILTSGLESIPTEVYEAAAIDGVTGWSRFWRITLPMLYPALFTVLILSAGVTFGIFTEVYILTKGGPDNATNTWQMEIFTQAFSKLDAGYGSAIAILASVVTFASIYVIRKLMEKWGDRYGWE
ncbi:carbohydrate ABC transporter permease [Tumebacillus permanentifrigoris]|uniref:Carbohydrate ABC transporter membrane protein 1 (CUT1 family) n=1 Tax=Tumebacillus permanentifrigoris TaxID=378543 RepID=A0A316DDX2_9BACL|nr:sugar ABC transporter permease [Tumebacillus permanentifrigoris]PWK16411.1 carbohydrate ABC transporter membrane protein 1 (CUT1 family) [Tumebacillus permanentifrigoris]